MLLSGDINLNPGPFHNHVQLDHDEWNVIKHRGLHFLHLVLLPKIDEHRRKLKIIKTNSQESGS